MINAQLEYVLHYQHGGQTWATSFFAVDDADAAQKVESLKGTLELKGRLLGTGGSTLDEAAESAAQAQTANVLRRASR